MRLSRRVDVTQRPEIKLGNLAHLPHDAIGVVVTADRGVGVRHVGDERLLGAQFGFEFLQFRLVGGDVLFEFLAGGD